MKLLRNALYLTAGSWAACGIAVALFPATILVRWFDQPPYPDDAYVRSTGIVCAGMALLMVLVAQKLDAVWWWSWAFAITSAGLGTLSAAHAIWGLPPHAGALLWWLFAGGNFVFTALILLGMESTSHEKPFV